MSYLENRTLTNQQINLILFDTFKPQAQQCKLPQHSRHTEMFSDRRICIYFIFSPLYLDIVKNATRDILYIKSSAMQQSDIYNLLPGTRLNIQSVSGYYFDH